MAHVFNNTIITSCNHPQRATPHIGHAMHAWLHTHMHAQWCTYACCSAHMHAAVVRTGRTTWRLRCSAAEPCHDGRTWQVAEHPGHCEASLARRRRAEDVQLRLPASCATGCRLLLTQSTKKNPTLDTCRKGSNSNYWSLPFRQSIWCHADTCLQVMQPRKACDSPVQPPRPSPMPKHQGVQGRRHAGHATDSGAGRHSAWSQQLLAQSSAHHLPLGTA